MKADETAQRQVPSSLWIASPNDAQRKKKGIHTGSNACFYV